MDINVRIYVHAFHALTQGMCQKILFQANVPNVQILRNRLWGLSKMVDWDSMDSFERYSKVSDILKNVGDFSDVVFQDDGKEIKAETLQSALKAKGMKNIKARDSIIFVVKDSDGDNMELWLSASSYTNLRELKAIRDTNNKTLKGAKVHIERIGKDDMTKPSFKFTKA